MSSTRTLFDLHCSLVRGNRKISFRWCNIFLAFISIFVLKGEYPLFAWMTSTVLIAMGTTIRTVPDEEAFTPIV